MTHPLFPHLLLSLRLPPHSTITFSVLLQQQSRYAHSQTLGRILRTLDSMRSGQLCSRVAEVLAWTCGIPKDTSKMLFVLGTGGPEPHSYTDRDTNIKTKNDWYLNYVIDQSCDEAEVMFVVDELYCYLPPARIAHGLARLGRQNDLPASYRREYGDCT